MAENIKELNSIITSMIHSKELKKDIKNKMLKTFDGNGILLNIARIKYEKLKIIFLI